MSFWMLVGGVLALAVLIALLLGVVWLVRDLVRGRDRPAPSAPPSPGPREILERRYAAGEIDDDEYIRRGSTLSR